MIMGVRKEVHERPKSLFCSSVSDPTAAGSWPSGPSPPPWIDLPRDVTANILQRLGVIEILESAQKVCATWWRVCKDYPSLWRVIHMKKLGHGNPKHHKYLELMCLLAVDRSLSELIDIDIDFFGTDYLLRYISNQSSRLRRLSIACCDRISGRGLTLAVKKLPELEELHLFYMTRIDAGDIEAIGICCPMLKSFTFNIRGQKFPAVDNGYALTIAKKMPNLRHLGLFGNLLGDQGLKAILDGCPHLESLDIRQCFRVELRGDLVNICSERIKDLRRPFDSTADYEWDDEVYDYEGDVDSDDSYDYNDYNYYTDYEDYEDYGQNEYDDYDPYEFRL